MAAEMINSVTHTKCLAEGETKSKHSINIKGAGN